MLMVCTGTGCKAYKCDDLARNLRDEVKAQGLEKDVEIVATVDNLGVTGHDPHVRGCGGRAECRGDTPQLVDLEPLFDDETGGQVERLRPDHGQVVDGAADGQLADIAAVKKQGFDHITIRGET